MTRFLRTTGSRRGGYVALLLFAAAYLSVVAILLAPRGSFVAPAGATAALSR